MDRRHASRARAPESRQPAQPPQAPPATVRARARPRPPPPLPPCGFSPTRICTSQSVDARAAHSEHKNCYAGVPLGSDGKVNLVRLLAQEGVQLLQLPLLQCLILGRHRALLRLHAHGKHRVRDAAATWRNQRRRDLTAGVASGTACVRPYTKLWTLDAEMRPTETSPTCQCLPVGQLRTGNPAMGEPEGEFTVQRLLTEER